MDVYEEQFKIQEKDLREHEDTYGIVDGNPYRLTKTATHWILQAQIPEYICIEFNRTQDFAWSRETLEMLTHDTLSKMTPGKFMTHDNAVQFLQSVVKQS